MHDMSPVQEAEIETAVADRGRASTEDFIVVPPVRFRTDNAVMVAWAGIERPRIGLDNESHFAPVPRWPSQFA